MTNRTSATKTAWLFLASEGGRWTTAEVLDRVHILSRTMLNAMFMNGQLQRWESTDGISRWVYGVTPGCKVPQGVKVSELVTAGVIK